MYHLTEKRPRSHRASQRAGTATWRCDLRIRGDLQMAGVVREILRAALRPRGSDDFVDTACLLATEIVSNALRHGDRSVHVMLSDDGCLLHCTANDNGPHFRPPCNGSVDELSESGRGLLLVDACSTRWGVRSSTATTGNEVWFELVEHTCRDADECRRADGN